MENPSKGLPESPSDNLSSPSDARNNMSKSPLKHSEEVNINSQDNKEFSSPKCGDSLKSKK